MDTLPVSLLLPTRNSMGQLPRHIATVRDLLPHVRELVVVDSESRDGTVELLRREFGSARFLTHPPGLYESWNFGVSACAAEYVYISTVGDAMTADGLRQLVKTAGQFACDVVISPPKLVDEHGTSVTKRWPIFEIIEGLKLEVTTVFTPEQAFLLALTFMRKAILGSSASNVYRTECLRERPFPTDFGHAGDVGWGLRHSADIRLGILPDEISTFVFHARTKRVAGNADTLRIEAARMALARVRESISPETNRIAEKLCDLWQYQFAAQRRREKTSAWYLRPSGWRDRRQHRQAAAELKEMQRHALALIEQQLRS
ncbi:MAG TPA: glycosyltransferase [Candidatus Acidoferrum sp.]|nr:glycosyltransferase [Candidatus Acidoferrum sp.]